MLSHLEHSLTIIKGLHRTYCITLVGIDGMKTFFYLETLNILLNFISTSLYQDYCFQTLNNFLLSSGYCTWEVEFDFDLLITLTLNIRLLYFAKIAITYLFMIGFESYFDKTTFTWHTTMESTQTIAPHAPSWIPPNLFVFLFLKDHLINDHFPTLFPLSIPHPPTHIFETLKDRSTISPKLLLSNLKYNLIN